MDELNPNTAPSNGIPLNRANDVDTQINNVTDTTEQFLTVGLETIDGAIDYYFNNVIKPQITENGSVVAVPVYYGSQERWASVQKFGYLRDNKQKLLTPAIVYKRVTVGPDTSLPVDKLDANNPQLYYTGTRKYTQKNRYDNFAVLTGQVPVKEFYNVVMPTYIIATYEVVMWTAYTQAMNSIVESMIYASKAYWGDPTKFRFRAYVSDVSTPTDITTETDRTSKSTFTLTVNGYLVPNTINKILSQAGNTLRKALSIKKTVTFIETSGVPVAPKTE